MTLEKSSHTNDKFGRILFEQLVLEVVSVYPRKRKLGGQMPCHGATFLEFMLDSIPTVMSLVQSPLISVFCLQEVNSDDQWDYMPEHPNEKRT